MAVNSAEVAVNAPFVGLMFEVFRDVTTGSAVELGVLAALGVVVEFPDATGATLMVDVEDVVATVALLFTRVGVTATAVVEVMIGTGEYAGGAAEVYAVGTVTKLVSLRVVATTLVSVGVVGVAVSHVSVGVGT